MSVPRYLDQYIGLWATYALDMTALIADVAGRLGITVDAATPAVYAAVDYIIQDTGVGAIDLPPSDPMLVGFGIPLLAMRMYQDAPNFGGETNNIDPTFAGIYTAARLYSHLDEYWKHLRVNWGIA